VKNRGVQIIFESHSEHLLRRVQRRIAEKKFSREDASLYFCRVEGRKAKIEALELDLFGKITNWPAEFFGDPFSETAAINEASIKNQMAAQE